MTGRSAASAFAVPTWVCMLVLAPIVGSFLGVVLRREGASWLWQRSACESCGQSIAWYDLAPIASFLILRGRCRWCGGRIAWFHPAIELAAILIAGWAIASDTREALIASCCLGWLLLALSVADITTFRLPDVLTLPLLLLGLLVTAIDTPQAIGDHALAAAAGYLSFWLIGAVYLRLRGRAGLGLGDAKLTAAAGAWLGLYALPDLVLIAASLALVVVLGMRLAGYAIDARTRLPFGPFLALSAWLLWLCGA